MKTISYKKYILLDIWKLSSVRTLRELLLIFLFNSEYGNPSNQRHSFDFQIFSTCPLLSCRRQILIKLVNPKICFKNSRVRNFLKNKKKSVTYAFIYNRTKKTSKKRQNKKSFSNVDEGT